MMENVFHSSFPPAFDLFHDFKDLKSMFDNGGKAKIVQKHEDGNVNLQIVTLKSQLKWKTFACSTLP